MVVCFLCNLKKAQLDPENVFLLPSAKINWLRDRVSDVFGGCQEL